MREATTSQGRRKRRIVLVTLVLVAMAASVALAVRMYDENGAIMAAIMDALTDEPAATTSDTKTEKPFYLLLLGIDRDQSRVEDEEEYGPDEHADRSDTIMLCRIDPERVKVTMVSMHRDTLVDMGEHGRQKLNAAYSIGGAAYAVKVASELAGVPVSHYAQVDLDRFIEVVDTVGGVDVDLPVPVRDPDYTGLDLPAGRQHLDAREAALLCRCRHGYDEYGDGDVYRAANQRMVLSEVVRTVMRKDPATVASAITCMADCVTTDMNLDELLTLAVQMRGIDMDRDVTCGMEPTEGEQIDGVWYEICDRDAWVEMMTRVDAGLPPYADDETNPTEGIAGSAS